MKSHRPKVILTSFPSVTIEHVTGKGPAVTGSGPTLLDALARATAAFEKYARQHVEDRLAGRNPDARHTPPT